MTWLVMDGVMLGKGDMVGERVIVDTGEAVIIAAGLGVFGKQEVRNRIKQIYMSRLVIINPIVG